MPSTIRFLKRAQMYNPGEVATFSNTRADGWIAKGVAELVNRTPDANTPVDRGVQVQGEGSPAPDDDEEKGVPAGTRNRAKKAPVTK